MARPAVAGPQSGGFDNIHLSRGEHLAKPNYQYEKRQRELAHKKKQEEKRLRKLNKNPVEEPKPGELPPQAEGEPK